MCLRNDQVEYVTSEIIIAFGRDNIKKKMPDNSDNSESIYICET